MRDIIQMACGECKRRNYSTTKNKKKTTERLEMKKYLPVLPEAPAAQGAEVGAEASSSIGRAPVSKTGGWGFDSLLACHP